MGDPSMNEIDQRSEAEAERVRDEALRRALMSPPKPHKPAKVAKSQRQPAKRVVKGSLSKE